MKATPPTKNSCVKHPENEPLLVLRQWQLAACDGDVGAAALLAYLGYWHDVRLDQAGIPRNSPQAVTHHGTAEEPNPKMLQYHNEAGLEKGIFGIRKRSTIARSIRLLEKKGFISTHTNPRWRIDQTRHFLFHPDKVNEWLKSSYVALEFPSTKNNASPAKGGGSSTDNEASSADFEAWRHEINGTSTENSTENRNEIAGENTADMLRYRAKNPDAAFANGDTQQDDAFTEAEILSIYNAFPNKVNKLNSLKEIKNALKFIASGESSYKPSDWTGDWPPQDPVEFLLGRVTEYFELEWRKEQYADSDGNFKWYPDAWLRAGCYIDDDDIWPPEDDEDD